VTDAPLSHRRIRAAVHHLRGQRNTEETHLRMLVAMTAHFRSSSTHLLTQMRIGIKGLTRLYVTAFARRPHRLLHPL
jgi:hypothetical protein